MTVLVMGEMNRYQQAPHNPICLLSSLSSASDLIRMPVPVPVMQLPAADFGFLVEACEGGKHSSFSELLTDSKIRKSSKDPRMDDFWAAQ